MADRATEEAALVARCRAGEVQAFAPLVRRFQNAVYAVVRSYVRNPDEAVRDPQVLARGETVRLTHPEYGAVEDVIAPGLPIRFSGSHAGFDQPAPAVGEHNDQVYLEFLGYTSEKLAELRAAEIV